MTATAEIRALVRETQNAIKSSEDTEEIVKRLKEVKKLLPPQNLKTSRFEYKHGEKLVLDNPNDAESEIRKQFMTNHYAAFGSFILDQISFDKIRQLSKQDFVDCFQYYFLEGYSEDAFLVLIHTISYERPGFKLNKCVLILEEFLSQHKLFEVLYEQSGLTKDAATSMMDWRRDGRALLWENLITEMASLPDKMANKLKTEVSEIFLPDNYLALLVSDIQKTLTTVCRFIRLSRDCSLEFVSRLVGKLCLCGYADKFWDLMLRELSTLRHDYIWSRAMERIVTGVPDRCIESVLVPLIKHLPWYGLMDRFLGNSVTQNLKIQLIVCTKLVFHRYFKNVTVLQNVIGYLATASVRQHLFVKLLFDLTHVWGDQSSINHTSYEQHFYLSQALVVCMAFIPDSLKQEHRDEILRLLMPGVQTHIGSSEVKVRQLGMLIAEVVTATIDPEGPKLNFEYDKDEEILGLRGLLLVPEDPLPDSELMFADRELASALREECILAPSSVLPTDNSIKKKKDDPVVTMATDSDLDSDDDLEPYDMSHDTKTTKVKQPKYIRDCMEGLISGDNPDTLEACLSVAESLIRNNPDGLQEVSVEFTKILLHLTSGCSLPEFRSQRFNALVALAVTCPKQVAEFLTEQFYDRNFSIRQRLDIIEVIGTAAQELSKPKEEGYKHGQKDSPKIQEVQSTTDEVETWRDVVQRRIESNTRRFGQGRTRPEPDGVVNKFAAVAGYFFYPLMRNFDRQENTFDLLGEDCYVLSRLLFTLGIVMYAATNIPTVRQMAVCLLEFIWVLRYHAEPSVRQGLLFAVSMVYLAVPAHTLLGDLQQEVFESKNWLEDVIDKDVDTQCKTLAVQALVLLENIIKQEFLTDSEKV